MGLTFLMVVICAHNLYLFRKTNEALDNMISNMEQKTQLNMVI